MSAGAAKVRVLTFTNLYPNSVQTAHGMFVERRLLRLVAQTGIEATVVAPVPWVPPPIGYLPRYRNLRRIASMEERDGIRVFHPRFLSIPGMGLYLAPFAMLIATFTMVRRLMKSDGAQIIDAHYFYPDGVAAAFIARILRKPLVITARGTDVNLLPNFWFSRVLIRWAADVAHRIITVSEALRAKLIELGVSRDKITTLRNGVDTDEFVMKDRQTARQRLGLNDGLVLLTVGNLIESKGHHLVIEALANLPGTQLVVVGGGDRAEHLRELAARVGVADRVRFAGTLNVAELVEYYNAADMLVLASEREGMPNVVLEALSCGMPVIATRCGGVAEVIDRPEFGLLLEERSSSAIARAVRDLLARRPARQATRDSARALEWGTTIAKQATLYRGLVSPREASA